MTKTEFLKYLADLRSYYEGYHTHKELSVWAAIALLVVLLFGILQSFDDVSSMCSGNKTIITLVIIVLTVIVLCYVCRQSRLRKQSSDYISACHVLESRVLSSSQFDPAMYPMTRNPERRAEGDRILPQIILTTIDQVHTERIRIRYRWIERVTNFDLDWIRYILVLGIAGTAILVIWL